ncbi:MAG: hypothetical protein ACJ79S_03125 [Gemmatimonadaceae bacterium]
MSHSHRRRPATVRDHPRSAGRRLLGATALVLGALVLAPWLAGHLTRWSLAPAVAALLALFPALYYWFRRAQGAPPRTAAALAVAYAALAAGLLWLWSTA